MPSKDGWALECEHDKVTLGKKQYRNMEEWSRPCAVCGGKFSIFVRASAASVNASFGLRTCKEHRGQKLGTPGTAVFEQHEELEQLQTWAAVWYRTLEHVQTKFPDATMQNIDERAALLIQAADTMHANYQSLFEELQVVKARLARYELQPAMQAMARMPWES